MNSARQSAVNTLNAENPGSAVFFETNGMHQGYAWGYHYEGLAENYLQIGWLAGQAAVENGFVGSEIIPEPSSAAMVLTGLLAAALRGQRRRTYRRARLLHSAFRVRCSIFKSLATV